MRISTVNVRLVLFPLPYRAKWLFLSFLCVCLVLVKGNPAGDRVFFVDPIKNITSVPGSNVEFFCSVKNLGNSRIMWVKKEEDRDFLLGINTLKVSKNPRISVSLLPSSGDVSQSILYINNIEGSDNGVYHCIVDSTPMKIQVGSLVVKENPPPPLPIEPVEQLETVPAVESTTERPQDVKSTEGEKIKLDSESESNDKSAERKSESNHDQDKDNSSVFCIDMKKVWVETRQVANYLFSILEMIF